MISYEDIKSLGVIYDKIKLLYGNRVEIFGSDIIQVSLKDRAKFFTNDRVYTASGRRIIKVIGRMAVLICHNIDIVNDTTVNLVEVLLLNLDSNRQFEVSTYRLKLITNNRFVKLDSGNVSLYNDKLEILSSRKIDFNLRLFERNFTVEDTFICNDYNTNDNLIVNITEDNMINIRRNW
jgi:hypothetical protein